MTERKVEDVESIFAIELTEAELAEVSGAEPKWRSGYIIYPTYNGPAGGGFFNDMLH